MDDQASEIFFCILENKRSMSANVPSLIFNILMKSALIFVDFILFDHLSILIPFFFAIFLPECVAAVAPLIQMAA